MRDGHEVGRVCVCVWQSYDDHVIGAVGIVCNHVTWWYNNTGDCSRQLLYRQTKECGALVSYVNPQLGSVFIGKHFSLSLSHTHTHMPGLAMKTLNS